MIESLGDGWGLDVEAVHYAAVGGGSYHWVVDDLTGTRSFVTGRFILSPGKEPHPIHQHEDEEILIVASGAGEISCAGKITQVGPGSSSIGDPLLSK